MERNKVFISYSRAEKQYLDELLPHLWAAGLSRDDVWFDEGQIDIGDEFHDKIQGALADSGVAILLLSPRFLTSTYIKQHELPYLLKQAKQQALKLGPLYVTAIPDAAFKVTIEVDGRKQTVNLKDYLGAHSPNEPLNTLDAGARDTIYAKLADWVTRQLAVMTVTPPRPPTPLPRRLGRRFELAITLRARRDHWEHSFSLPHAADFTRPELDCPTPEELFRYASNTVDGEDLFHLLFGRDEQKSGEILGAAFEEGATADPTRHPLRVRLRTNDERLYALPWASITHKGRRLAVDGWTVELHADSTTGFPEYPPHTCYFPGKVVLVGAHDQVQTPQGTAHFQDLQHFFQRRWQKTTEPILVSTDTELHAALNAGSPRLVYYYGPVSQEGLLLAGADGHACCVPWSTLAELLQRSRSVSVVFLNLLGEASFATIPQGRLLFDGARAVLVQCNERTAAPDAAQAALAWLHSVFAASEQLDPVVALSRHQHGQIAAWTRYSSWQTIVPPRLETSELVHLLLDRRSQRAELSNAKDEFYTLKARRVYHAVALGTAGGRITEFPTMVSQHLRHNKREQEVFIHRSIPITATLDNAQRVDDLVHRQFGITPRQSVIGALLQQDTARGNDFWFLVLGWVLQHPLADVEAGARLMHTIADWCRTRLLKDMPAGQHDTNIRALSVVAIETISLEAAEALAEHITDLTESLNDEDGFHFGELERLASVRLQDLRNYFQDTQICSCDDRYRREFPRILLGARPEMLFDEAVTTIRRGEPDNWGTLYEELRDMTAAGDWPPPPDTVRFWESRDGR